MASSLSHLFVLVRDLGETHRFYVGLLGLEVLMGGPDQGYMRVGGGDGFHVGFEADSALDPTAAAARGIEIVVRVDDVDRTVARLREVGVAVDRPPEDQEWGSRHAWLRDPSGHRLSIYSPNTGAPPADSDGATGAG